MPRVCEYHQFEGRNWVYDEDLPISFEGFSFDNYSSGEREILQPQLERLGFRVTRWAMGEADSFGPLSRIAHMFDSEDTHVIFCYG